MTGMEIYLTAIEESPLALRVTNGKRRPWLPKSQIQVTRFRGPAHPQVLISLPVWLARKTGLMEKQS